MRHRKAVPFRYSLSIGALRGAGKAVLCWAVVAAATTGQAEAATQGLLAPTSTGSITITATVPKIAQITALSDVTFTPTGVTSDAVSAQNDCVFINTASKNYSITASGNGTAKAFTLANGTATVPYSVQWNMASGSSTGTALTTATALAGQTTTATSPACATSPTTTSSLIVTIAAADLQTMVAGNAYTGTLGLLITPQ